MTEVVHKEEKINIQVPLTRAKNADLLDFIMQRAASKQSNTAAVSREIFYIGMHFIEEMEKTPEGTEALQTIIGKHIHKI